MFRILMMIFIIVPIIEMWGLISMGKWIGVPSTILFVVLTGVIGAWLAKQQGIQILRLVQFQLSKAQMPTDALLDGVFVLTGGVLLLTPGFFSDLFGFIFLIPFTRAILRELAKRWLQQQIRSGRIITMFRR
ncbi:FxsA family protein [Brevibacillus dissolubilis]|uniref:FxsA family protein n=1 Tax=Brevibacillus dissolubilis TaxID=1844116 RepID=UPI0011170E10|nr:FxsA family protein [Brevibacillus dissolubilis]